MKMKKMLGAFALSAALTMGMASMAFADPAVGTNTNIKPSADTNQATAQTVIKLTSTLVVEVPNPEPGTFQISVTVPIDFTVVAEGEGGALMVPENYGITNYSMQTAHESWTAGFNTPAGEDGQGAVDNGAPAAEEIDAAAFAMDVKVTAAANFSNSGLSFVNANSALNDDEIWMKLADWDLNDTFPAAWTIPGDNTSKPIAISGATGKLTQDLSNTTVNLVTVTYTIDAAPSKYVDEYKAPIGG